MSLVGLIRFLSYSKKENLNLFNVTGLLTFCFQTEMSPTKTCPNLLIHKIKGNDEHFCILLFQHTAISRNIVGKKHKTAQANPER